MKRTYIAAALALAALSPVVAAPAWAATTSGASASTASAPTSLPPVNDEALKRSIAGLPAADATAADVRVGGSAGTWRGVSGVTGLRTQRPAKEGARFRVGSVTKVFTTAVVLQSVAEGKVKLDGTVQEYLPGLLPEEYPDITVGQLLNHTSGLPAPKLDGSFEEVYANRYKRITPAEYVKLAVQNPIEFTPGTAQHYLNINTFVAGLLIEKVTGTTYEKAVAERILRPQRLRDTYLPGESVKIKGRHNLAYQVVPKGFPDSFAHGGRYLVDITNRNVTTSWASGDLISTTADLETFIKALFSGRIVPKAYMEPLFTVPKVKQFGGDKDAAYTSGLTELVLPGGIVAYGKSGAQYGSAAGIGATRDLRRTLTYVVNSTDAKAEGQNQRTLGVIMATFGK
ncbi:serine hydrolase domain-containing protein [Nonomuraea longicatena]|uniref:Serine hydrolase domain-containing protein n=1 Tax=Nonomuraea longicatena TaxID=83682 RepID=A0ABN1P9V7_9ACTN